MNRVTRNVCSILKQHNTVPCRQAHSGVMNPLKLRSLKSPDKMPLQLLSAIRKRNPGEVWKAYKDLSDNDKLGTIPTEYYTLTLQSFQLKNLDEYNETYVKFFGDCLKTVFDNMKAQHRKPDIRDYNLMLDFYGRSKDWNMTEQLWKEIEEPNQYSYNLYLEAALLCNKFEDAFKIYNMIKNTDKGPNEFTYNAMIQVHGRMGNINDADKLFQSIYEPKTAKHPSLISTLIHDNKEKKTSYAAHFSPIERIAPEKPKPSTETFAALIDAHGRNKNILGLSYIYNTMMPSFKVEPDLKIYNALIQWYCRNEEIQAAQKVFKDMEGKQVQPDVVTFNHFFRHEALKRNRPKVAENLMDFMKKQYGITPLLSMYKTLIKSHNKANREEDAKRLYKDYVQLKNRTTQPVKHT